MIFDPIVRIQNLVTIIVGLIVVTMIPIISWLWKYRRITTQLSEDDSWLTDEREKVTHGEPNAFRAGIAALRGSSLVKKGIALILVGSLIFSGIWLAWEIAPFADYSHGVENSDTRVFTTAYFDDETMECYIEGHHNHLLDRRSCQVEYFLQVSYEEDLILNISVDWELEYSIFAGSSSTALIQIRTTLYDSDGDGIESHNFLDETYQNNSTSRVVNGLSQVQFQWWINGGSTYYVGVGMRVTLSGDSSIEGLQLGTPAVLRINNMTFSSSLLM